MIHEQCDSGITVRGLRRAFCGEVQDNIELVQQIAAAAGIVSVERVLSASMKGHGGDLSVTCLTEEDDIFEIGLCVHIDSLNGCGPMSRGNQPRPVKTVYCGQKRYVTIAPPIWFAHKGNAEGAENMITFDELEERASHDLWLAIQRAKTRAANKFAALAARKPSQPKAKLPWWAARRMRQRW